MDLRAKINVTSLVGKLQIGNGGSVQSEAYLLTNQGNGMRVIDLRDYSERIITNAEMNSSHISDKFHLNFNSLYRNCHAVVADSTITVHWVRSSPSSYTRQDVTLTNGQNQFLWGASEFGGYAIVALG